MHRQGRGSYFRELKNLQSNINYEGDKPKKGGREEGTSITQLFIMTKTICTWNVRGLGREEKQWGIKDD